MNIILYTYSKKKNSTSAPSTGGTTFTCKLKNNCGVVTPVIEFTNNNTLPSYNYAYISAFSRYYFINDWIFSDNKWIATMEVDVLASFKTQIGNQYKYVLRSASDYDYTIIDTVYPQTLDMDSAINESDNTVNDTTINASITNYFSKSFEDGYYVIGVIGNNSTGVTYYTMPYSTFATFIYNITQFIPQDMGDIAEGIARSLANILQYITCCYWFPSTPGGAFSTRTISFGRFNVEIDNVGVLGDGALEGPFIHKFTDTIGVSRHPQNIDGTYFDDYLNTSPYTERKLVFNPFGEILLDTNKMASTEFLGVRLAWYVDYTTGLADLYVYDKGNATLISSHSAQFGVPIKISQIVSDTIQIIKDAAKPITSAIKGAIIGASLATPVAALSVPALAGTGAVAGGVMTSEFGSTLGTLIGFGVGKVESGISSLLNNYPTVSTLGNNGTLLAFNSMIPTVFSTFYKIPDRDNTNLGRPLCKYVQLKTLSGYMQCRDGNVSISGYKQENDLIANYLTTGYYYE